MTEIRTLREYYDTVKQTAVYPDMGSEMGRYYVLLGLIGESGETVEKAKKWLRGDRAEDEETFRANMAKEVGDCAWYASMTCFEFSCLDLLDNHHGDRVIGETPSLQTKEFLDEVMHISHLANYCAQDFTSGYTVSVRFSLERLLTQLMFVSNMLGFSFTEVLQMNAQKLLDRKRRGVLKGSGDER